MGDGLPAFAPQWLKASNNSLRTGTQGSSQSKEEASKASWRESGSRLGLGAGADREALDSRPTPSANKRQSQYSERGGSYTSRGGSDRGASYRSSNARPLSDRELVEQTSALKLRPGRDTPDTAFLGDSFHTGYGPKDPFASRGAPAPGTRSGGRRHAGQRGSLHNGRAQDRDFANLGRFPNLQPRGQASSALLSPRTRQQQAEVPGTLPGTPASLQSPKVPHTEQQWTTRLADTPHEVPGPGQLADFAASLHRDPGQGSSPAASVQKEAVPMASPAASISELSTRTSAPRMADAIVQAQAAAAQEAEAERAEKLRKEQLALRQSKQLVPVVATPRAKHAASAAPSLGSLPSKKPSGMESLGKSSIQGPARKEVEATNGVRRATLGKPSAPGTPAAKPAPVTMRLPARRGREHDRLSFFSSLKCKSSAEASGLTNEEGNLARQVSSTASDASQDPMSPPATKLASMNGQRPAGLPESSMPEMLPEEVAFMKSLGWTGDLDDDAEGGLTEEEVAAFKAAYPGSCTEAATTKIAARGSCIEASAPVSMPQNKAAAQNGNHAKDSNHKSPQVSHSFHSELEFSDSESD